MKIFLYFSDFIVPFAIFYIIIYGFFNGIDVYESFLRGVKEGFWLVIKIAPTMVALLASTAIFRTSGALDFISGCFAPIGHLLHMPTELIPLMLVRIFSSSAGTGFLLDLFKTYGPDSMLGVTASIMMSCTESIVYTMSIYFMSVGIKKTRWTLAGACIATLAGVVASLVIGSMV